MTFLKFCIMSELESGGVSDIVHKSFPDSAIFDSFHLKSYAQKRQYTIKRTADNDYHRN